MLQSFTELLLYTVPSAFVMFKVQHGHELVSKYPSVTDAAIENRTQGREGPIGRMGSWNWWHFVNWGLKNSLNATICIQQ